VIPQPLQILTSELSRLPGIGTRTAERLALYLVLNKQDLASRVAQAILDAKSKIRICPVCGALFDASENCFYCNDPSRRDDLICVVERATDILSIDKSSSFKGCFHVLGGKLSPINGIGPEDLKIASLLERIKRQQVTEVVMALGMDVESDATVYFIAQQLKNEGVQVSRLAQGLPVGVSLEYADRQTLSMAIENRIPIRD